VLEALLRALHPIMPFITEEIWQRVAPIAGVAGETIMRAAWPSAADYPADAAATADVDWMKGVILGLRQIRGEMDISPARRLAPLVQGATVQDAAHFERHAALLGRLAGIDPVRVLTAGENAPPSAAAVVGQLTLLVPMQGLIDPAEELARLRRKRGKEPAGDHPRAGQAGKPELCEPCPARGGGHRTRAHRAVRKGEREPRAADCNSGGSRSDLRNGISPMSDLPAVLRTLDSIILGKSEALRLALTCLLARGHLLIEDVPGVGKTTLAHALAQVLGLAGSACSSPATCCPPTSSAFPSSIALHAAVRIPQGPGLHAAAAGR
jgi:hypothetical protein